MKLTNEEIAKVFGMYLGSEIEPLKVNDGGFCRTDTCLTISNINLVLSHSLKLKLSLFEDISDYHLIEFIKLLDERTFDEYTIKRNQFNEPMIRVHAADEHTAFDFSINEDFSVRYCRCGTYSNFPVTYEAFMYLVSNKYAVPLFFEPNHWANGKTAIDLGIALKINK